MRIRYEIAPAEPPSYALVTVLSGLLGEPPEELGPLGPVFDLEALDDLFDHPEATSPAGPSVRLSIGGHGLTIRPTEIVVEAGGPAGARPSRRGIELPDRAADRPEARNDGGSLGTARASGCEPDSGGTAASNVLLLAPAESDVEARTCSELRPDTVGGGASVLEIDVEGPPTELARTGVDAVRALERRRARHDRVGLCLDSVSTLVGQAGLHRTYRFLHVLTRLASRLDVEAHYHADPNEHDLRTTYLLETLADSIVVAGDVPIAPPRG